MADKQKIIEVLTGEYQYAITSILIDELGYSVYKVLPVTDKTLDTDTVIVAYSVQESYKGEIVADTHFIPLSELLGADTVVFGIDGDLCTVN